MWRERKDRTERQGFLLYMTELNTHPTRFTMRVVGPFPIKGRDFISVNDGNYIYPILKIN